jgi:hypothetical protein
MEAIRCKDCGDVRWSFFGRGRDEPERCSLCGGEMVVERRKPHSEPSNAPTERRGGKPERTASTGFGR